MRYTLTLAALVLMLLAGCSSGGTGDAGTGAAAETPAVTTDDTGTTGDTGTMTDTAGTGDAGATDTMTDTAASDDAGATDTMTDTAGTGDPGATDTMTDTAATGDAGATDTMTDTAATGDAGATDTMTDTAGAGTSDAAGAAAGGAAAHAELMTADGTVVGMAHFTDTADGGVMVQVDVAAVAGAAAGDHGIHVHMVGACDPPDFMSAGEHFNPTAMKHGLENPDGPHAGDMPNITMDDAGNGAYSTTTTMFTVGAGDSSLMDADGSAIIIHANPDDQVTDPSGNSGARLVCGIIMADAAAQ